MSDVELLVAPCSYQAAKFAVEHWHYTRCMPAGKTVKFGVWENEQFIGVVIFSRGANCNIGSPYKLKQTEVCELTRVALQKHCTPVSKIVAASLRLLRTQNDGIRLIVSYADEQAQQHVGVIYQAMNWVYVGCSKASLGLRLGGKVVHKKTGHSRFGTIRGLPKSDMLWKHKYLYPLDRAMRRQIEPLAQPYPKREHAGD